VSSEVLRPIILASGSPRRAELLAQIGIRFEVQLPAVAVDETPLPGEDPAGYVTRLAAAKALAVAAAAPGRVILAADTTVVLDGRILGKPVDANDGIGMLLALQDRAHQVLTGVAVSGGGRTRSRCVTTEVRFRAIDRAEAEAYWATGEGADKAGSYGIQGIGAIFAVNIHGSYSNVVGLPLADSEALLREFGVETWVMRRRG